MKYFSNTDTFHHFPGDITMVTFPRMTILILETPTHLAVWTWMTPGTFFNVPLLYAVPSCSFVCVCWCVVLDTLSSGFKWTDGGPRISDAWDCLDSVETREELSSEFVCTEEDAKLSNAVLFAPICAKELGSHDLQGSFIKSNQKRKARSVNGIATAQKILKPGRIAGWLVSSQLKTGIAKIAWFLLVPSYSRIVLNV